MSNDSFFTGIDDNPFDDPDVRRITNQSSNLTNGFDDDNPFADPQVTPARGVTTTSQQGGPAVVQAKQDIPPPSKPTQAQNISSYTDFQRIQEEQDRRAAELERREAELRAREGQFNVRSNNWPPFPARCPVTPCFYIDIDVAVRAEFQSIVRKFQYLWYMLSFCLCVNVIGCTILLLVYKEVSMFAVSLLYLVLFIPLSALCWWIPIYKAFRDDSAFNFMVFFVVFFFQCLITIFMATGVIGTGSCGFLTAAHYFDGTLKGTVVGIIILLIAICFTSLAAAQVFMLSRVYSIYRPTVDKVNKAQQEFVTGMRKDENVQRAAGDFFSAAVSAGMAGNSQQSNRY